MTSVTYLNLFNLIQNNDYNGLEELLSKVKNKIDINQNLLPSMIDDKSSSLMDFLYYTPLYLATKLGNIDIVGLLLQHGANARTIVSEKNGLFASSYDLTLLNDKPELTEMFNKYVEKYNGVSVIKTKIRSENTTSFNFRRKSTELEFAPAKGKTQKF